MPLAGPRAIWPAYVAGKISVPMLWLLAWRNVAYEHVRLVVTIAGVSLSVLLMGIQGGLLIGCTRAAAALVDHVGADLWITSANTRAVDFAVEIDDVHRHRALAVPGVAAADALIVRYAWWRRPDGGNEVISIVGFDVARLAGVPWNLVAGSVSALRLPDTVIIDRLYAERLGVVALGDEVEIAGRRARVVGFTQGIRTFTQAPYVFASIENALSYVDLDQNQINYVLIRLRHRADAVHVARALREMAPYLDVLPTAEFSWRTSRYWLITTGVGIALILGALLTVVVGAVIVSQTLYTTTLERLPEYATLRAMGAPAAYLTTVVMVQAVISAILGYGFGLCAVGAVVLGTWNTHVPIVLPWVLYLTLAVLTLAMCVGASILAVRRLLRIDPTSVFR